MASNTKEKESKNVIIRDDESEFVDFDGDDTMEKMIDLFLFRRKEATFGDVISLLSFIVFLLVNVGCVSYNCYKIINDSIPGYLNDELIKKCTAVLYYTEFSLILIFAIIAIIYFILLHNDKTSKSALSNAANYTRLVREFSCFSLVPLFNVKTLTGIYEDISNTFYSEKKKYFDRSELWDGVWGVGKTDVQKTNAALELVIEENMEMDEEDENDPINQGGIKKLKHSKFYLFLISIFIYFTFFISLVIILFLAAFAFVALYIKTCHVSNFIQVSNDQLFFKWFNFITFIMNIASLSQPSPAIQLIIHQLKTLTKKAHFNEYKRKKQNKIKENDEVFNVKPNETIEMQPKIIIHKKKVRRNEKTTNAKTNAKTDANIDSNANTNTNTNSNTNVNEKNNEEEK